MNPEFYKNLKILFLLYHIIYSVAPVNSALIHRYGKSKVGASKGRSFEPKSNGNGSNTDVNLNSDPNAIIDSKTALRFYGMGRPAYVLEYDYKAKKYLKQQREARARAMKGKPRPIRNQTKPISMKGRQAIAAGLGGIATIIGSAVAVTGIISGVGRIVTTVLNGVVKLGELGLEIAAFVEEVVEKHERRAGTVKAILYEMNFLTQELCNVFVLNLATKAQTDTLKGWKYYDSILFENIWYGLWLIEGGYAINKEHWRAELFWGFAGNYELNGGKVSFGHKDCPFDEECDECGDDYSYEEEDAVKDKKD